MSYHELRQRRGDTWKREFTVLQADEETPQDITGATFRFTAKSDPDDADGDAVVTGTTGDGRCAIIDAANGVMRVTIPPTVTETVTAPGVYHFDLQATDAGGDVWTVAWGRLIVDRDISITQP